MACEAIGCGCKSRQGPKFKFCWMSYKNKKLKKSGFNQFKYRFGQLKLALYKRARKFLPKARSKTEFPEQGGAPVFQMGKVLTVFRRYDRMKNNPDISLLEKVILGQVQREGFLRLCIFICPKFDTKYLLSETPERYMPVEAGPDLFEQRIEKVLSLRKDLIKAGLPTEINLLIGDNDAEEYIFPFMPSLIVNTQLYRQRQTLYRRSFETRCQNIFGTGKPGFVVWSLGESRVTIEEGDPNSSEDNVQKEAEFFKWLFSDDGPYKGQPNFPEEVLLKMVKRKYKLYGAQGKFLELLGGILLQTEGPGLWLERTMMLRCTGSQALPAIYPWIRKEEIKQSGY